MGKVMTSIDNKAWAPVENKTFSLPELSLGRETTAKFGAAVLGLHFRIVPVTWAERKTASTNDKHEDLEMEVLRLLEEEDGAVVKPLQNNTRCMAAAILLECPRFVPEAL